MEFSLSMTLSMVADDSRGAQDFNSRLFLSCGEATSPVASSATSTEEKIEGMTWGRYL
jgi:hypothetical protein